MARRSYANSPLRFEWAFDGLSSKDTHRGTHAYHSYPMRFVPQLAESLVQEYSPAGGVVCDPFMGSGTTLIEAAGRDRRALGADINPLCQLITEAKGTLIDPAALLPKLRDLEDQLTSIERVAPVSFPDEVVERLHFWHPEEAYQNLSRILTVVRATEDKDIRRFMLCGFSQILKSCSLWSSDSTRAIRSEKRSRKPQDARKALLRQLNLMHRRNNTWWESSRNNPPSPVEAFLADARCLPVQDEAVDTVITSPPYVTSYDYAELHQLSLLWLGYCSKYQELRRNLIGSQYGVESEWTLEDLIDLSPTAFQIATDLSETTTERHLVRAVVAYFHDMWESASEMFRITRQGGRVVVVIGNTRLRGVDILNAEVLGEILDNIGFSPSEAFRRPIPVKSIPPTRDTGTGRFSNSTGSNPYAEEYVLVSQKPLQP
jgi:hypothetical protein